mgnify:CR=1 FL=1
MEIAKLVIELTRAKVKVVHQALPQDDPAQRQPDITLAKSLLQWEPKVNLRDGLIKTIGYFREESG